MKTKKKVFTRLTVLLLLFIAAAAMVPTASAAGWDHYREIEIDQNKVSGSANLDDFPVLLDLSGDWLKDTDHSGHIGKSDASDIVFTTGSLESGYNQTKLDWECEKYDGATGELVAWVRIPTLDHDADTKIRMWYGNSDPPSWAGPNPTGVWDGNYKSVWHLNETTGAIKDSTSNDNDGTGYGSPNLDVAGQIDGADAFDSTDDYLRAGTTNFEMQRGTYSAWVNFDNWANNQNDVLFSVPSEAAATSANLVGYWRGDELEGGNTVTDISGHGNDGTIYGTGGISESGTANTLTDTDQSWSVNEWAGETIYIDGGTGSGQERTVASNTATVITVTSAWDTNPDATSEYAVTPGIDLLAAGRFGVALGFDGTEGYVQVPDDASLEVGTGSFTIEAWIKLNTCDEWALIAEKGENTAWFSNSYAFGVNHDGNHVRFKGQWSNSHELDSTTSLELSKWYHVVGVRDGTNAYIYINGVKDESENNNCIDGGTTSGKRLLIGRDSATQSSDGTIDEVKIYNAAISEDRIRSLYLGALSAHKNADNNLVMHLGPATMTTDVSDLTGWHHVAGTCDNTPGKAYLFLDGVQKAEADFSGGTRRIFGDYSYFANDENDQMQSAGKMDEVRVSASARSADWIKTGYNNQDSPGTFYSVGDSTSAPEGTDPVPDPSALVLFAAGLVTLAVFFGWTKRRRGS